MCLELVVLTVSTRVELEYSSLYIVLTKEYISRFSWVEETSIKVRIIWRTVWIVVLYTRSDDDWSILQG